MSRPKTLVVLPSRLASTRLPDKPLADIGGAPMIVRVWERAVVADVGPVIVACGDAAIADAVREAGGTAVMTAADLPSGSDRVWVAAQTFDPDGAYEVIVNIQGDLPTLDPAIVRATVEALGGSEADIATPVARIVDDEERDNPNVVKAAVSFAEGAQVAPALYFSRQRIPSGDGDHYHHIGLYAFRRAALKRFVALPETGLERRERLEQLRALEDGMRITAALVDTIPLGVDTPADLERARRILAAKPSA